MDHFLRVLFVEDSVDDTNLIVRLLRMDGYEVEYSRVTTAEGMRTALENGSWDVVISDYGLATFSGPEALILLQSFDATLPFIVVSGPIGEEAIAMMLKLGASEYVMKGKYARLIPAIQRELQEAKERRDHLALEKELAYERSLLRTLLENLPHELYFKDLESRFTLLSHSQAEHLGLSSPVEALGKTDFDFFAQEHAQPAFETEQRILATGQAVMNIEEKETWKDGRITWVRTSKMPLFDQDGNISGTFGISSDITELKRMESLLHARMRLLEFGNSHSIEEMLVRALDEVGEITDSPIGFYHFVDEDQSNLTLQAWSTRTTQEFCTAAGKGSHYAVEQAGVWADALRERRAIIHNNYAGLASKKGLPEGHAQVHRELVVPIFRREKVVAILGVGNKPTDYTAQDLETVSYLADIAWHICSRVRTEQELRESEAHFRAVTESAIDAILTIDEAGKIVSWNRSAEVIFGWTKAEILGQPVSLLIPVSYHDVRDKGIQRVMQGGRPEVIGKTVELYAVRRDGSEFPIEISLSGWGTSKGKFSTAILRDISDRKQAEKALRDEEERYRGLYEHVPVGLFRMDPDGKIGMANSFLVRMLGYETLEELLHERFEKGDGKLLWNFRQRLAKDESFQGYEESIQKKDSSIVFVRESGRIIRGNDGQPEYYEGTLEDITSYFISQQQNRRLVTAVEQASEAMALCDSEGRVLYSNPAFILLFHLTLFVEPEENIYQIIGATLSAAEWQAILAVPRAGQVWKGDIHTQMSDGTGREIRLTISPVSSLQEDAVTGLGFVMSDVTQEKVAEIQSRHSQKLQAIGQLAAGIAHEINTPTQYIGNNLQFLQNGFQDLLGMLDLARQLIRSCGESSQARQANLEIRAREEQIDMEFLLAELPAAIDGSLKGIERISKIVNAMKEFSHPGTREKIYTNLNHAIENTLEVTRNEWKYEAEIVTALDPDLPLVPCLVDEFNQVILNLVTNAVDAIREAHAREQHREKGVIKISTALEGALVCVRVADNGTGIQEQFRDRIFEPFFTTKEVGKGTGQGLPISYDVIVNKHGGTITFESQAGKGCTFIIHLPLIPEDVTTQEIEV